MPAYAAPARTRARLGAIARRGHSQGGSATGPRLRPTAVVGQPYAAPPSPAPPPQGAGGLQVPEPAALVGMQTGQHYATLGDNPMGPETMSVSPPGAPPAPQLAPGPGDITLGREQLPVSMQEGGTAQVGWGWGRNAAFSGGGYAAPAPQPAPQPAPAYTPPAYSYTGTPNSTISPPNTTPGGPQAPAYDANQYDWLRRSLNLQQQNVLQGQGAQLDARAATLPYQQSQLAAQRAVLPYSYGVLNAQQGLVPLQQAQIGAERATLGARGASLAANRGYIAQEQAANQAGLVDIQAIRAAQANLPDITAVAQERQLRNQVDRSLYNRLGVEAPTEVTVEPGQENMLPPGMRAKLQTQEDIKTKQASYNAQVRANQLTNARLAVSLIDTNVEEAQQRAADAGLTLDQAKLLVTQAQQQEQRAQLGAQAAGYDVRQSQLGEAGAELGTERARLGESQAQYDLARFKDPSLEGYQLYTDPRTLERSWLTPAEADQRQFSYSQQQGYERIPEQYAQQQARTQYQTQQQAQGDPFPGYQPDDFVRMLYDSSVTSITGRADPMEGRIYESLYARYVQHYTPKDAANLAAIDLRGIKDRVAAARRTAARAGGGNSAVDKAVAEAQAAGR